MASSTSWEAARDRLKQIRDTQSRSCDEVVELWEDVLCDFAHKLGDEAWMIYEQVCVAACDCGRLDIAKVCYSALDVQFPKSLRVERLRGAYYESAEMYDKAVEVYEQIIEMDETNSLARKRLVAVLKGQNKISEAIEKLSKYLETFMSDTEAWMELCDLYLIEMDYAKAGYCMEELMMTNPHNHLFHQKYAEIKYTQGGTENMEIARRYFAQSVKLHPNNMRGLFGLFLAASNIASSKSATKKKDNVKYAEWAAKQIAEKYKFMSISSAINPSLAMCDLYQHASPENYRKCKPGNMTDPPSSAYRFILAKTQLQQNDAKQPLAIEGMLSELQIQPST